MRNLEANLQAKRRLRSISGDSSKMLLAASLICQIAAISIPVKANSPANPPEKSKTTQIKAPLSPPKAPLGGTSKIAKPLVKGSKLFMWRMTSQSGATIYFLGTIHIARKDLYPLPEEIEKAFEKSSILMVEADISDKKHEKSAELHDKSFYSHGDNVRNHISPATMRALEQYCAATDTSEEPFMRMQPWLISIAVHQREMKRMGFIYNNGIDLHFINKANASGKKVLGLEKEHDDVLAGMDADLQDKMLRLSLIGIDLATPDYLNKIFNAWRTGDENAMNSIDKVGAKNHKELEPAEDRILYDRNEKMDEVIEPYLKGDGTFMVAVGSAHLVGDRSMIDILKKRGYKVNQVLVGDVI